MPQAVIYSLGCKCNEIAYTLIDTNEKLCCDDYSMNISGIDVANLLSLTGISTPSRTSWEDEDESLSRRSTWDSPSPARSRRDGDDSIRSFRREPSSSRSERSGRHGWVAFTGTFA